jgi:hypothetical protein
MGTDDLTLNPEKIGEIQAEKTLINYFSNPSEQVPNKENIKLYKNNG